MDDLLGAQWLDPLLLPMSLLLSSSFFFLGFLRLMYTFLYVAPKSIVSSSNTLGPRDLVDGGQKNDESVSSVVLVSMVFSVVDAGGVWTIGGGGGGGGGDGFTSSSSSSSSG